MGRALPSLLIRSAIGAEESLRCYVARMAQINHAQSYFHSFAASIQGICDNISLIANLTGEEIATLKVRLAATRCEQTGRSMFQVGACELPAKSVSVQVRSLCLRCVHEGTTPPIFWDLVAYDVCHIHRCPLMTACPHCRKPFNWRSVSGYGCPCAQFSVVPISQTQLPERAAVCEAIAQSCLHSLHFYGGVRSDASAAAMPMFLGTLLLCMQFVEQIVIPPKFWIKRRRRYRPPCRAHERKVDVILSFLMQDPQYMFHLHERLCLYAERHPALQERSLMLDMPVSQFQEIYKPLMRQFFAPVSRIYLDMQQHRALLRVKEWEQG